MVDELEGASDFKAISGRSRPEQLHAGGAAHLGGLSRGLGLHPTQQVGRRGP